MVEWGLSIYLPYEEQWLYFWYFIEPTILTGSSCTTVIVFFLKKHFQIYLKDLWKVILQLNKVNKSVVPFLLIKFWKRNIIKTQKVKKTLLDFQERKKL